MVLEVVVIGDGWWMVCYFSYIGIDSPFAVVPFQCWIFRRNLSTQDDFLSNLINIEISKLYEMSLIKFLGFIENAMAFDEMSWAERKRDDMPHHWVWPYAPVSNSQTKNLRWADGVDTGKTNRLRSIRIKQGKVEPKPPTEDALPKSIDSNPQHRPLKPDYFPEFNQYSHWAQRLLSHNASSFQSKSRTWKNAR